MANPEHLEILRKGGKAFNQWRKDNEDIRPDLRVANLNGANLNGADLNGAYLNRANLREADLSGAYLGGAKLIGAKLSEVGLLGAKLIGADLSGAKLIGAKLSGAKLKGAGLFGANLSGADLSGADLSRADLRQAHLSGADFGEALCWLTSFAAVNLSKVKGLESVVHRGPSSIGIDTFFLSGGKIPEVFLRGAGVPDIFIEYAASLAGKTIEFYSAFISYSSKDEDLARRLHADLQDKGVRCWIAPEDLKIGDKFRTEIDRAIRLHDKLLLLLSANSVSSDWVEKEVETAFERERRDKRLVLFPIRLDDAVMDAMDGWAADIKRSRNIGDFTKWEDHASYQKAFERLLRDLKSDAKPEAEGTRT